MTDSPAPASVRRFKHWLTCSHAAWLLFSKTIFWVPTSLVRAHNSFNVLASSNSQFFDRLLLCFARTVLLSTLLLPVFNSLFSSCSLFPSPLLLPCSSLHSPALLVLLLLHCFSTASLHLRLSDSKIVLCVSVCACARAVCVTDLAVHAPLECWCRSPPDRSTST